MNTSQVLDFFDALFQRKPSSFTRTPETLDELQAAWHADGFSLVTRDVLHGESVLVMARAEAVRAAVDLGAERAWGLLP